MARFRIDRIPVQSLGVRAQLREASHKGGRDYEGVLGGAIVKRQIPILERIEERTGIPIVDTSLDKSRGRQSSQSEAIFQWHRGHRRDGMLRIPEVTVEILGRKQVVTHAFLMEISLQSDVTAIGAATSCRLKMGKTEQLVWSTSLLANKYGGGLVDYMYLCPQPPAQETQDRLLEPLERLRGTDNVTFTWTVVDHDQPG